MKNETANILSLVPYKFLPPQMGGQKCIALFNCYLSKTNNLICVGVKENETNYEQQYPIHPLLGNSKLRYINLFYFFTLKRFIQQHKITHLIIEHPYLGWLGILLKWSCKIKLIVHSHNIESKRFKSLGRWWWGLLWHYEKFVHRYADYSFFIQGIDNNYAIKNYKLNPKKCLIVTYGVEVSAAPAATEKKEAREYLSKTHGIAADEKILLFNGSLCYKPNLDALDAILNSINPVLLAENNFKYKIIICGNKLPAQYHALAGYKEKNIIYAGFVEDIAIYFKAADIFINPVIEGGGIKTKVVEALGYDLSVISTQSGATGIDVEETGEKMVLVADGDWLQFAGKIVLMNNAVSIPNSFFDTFYWGNIVSKTEPVFAAS
jgi:UDP-N-acetylglucosamine:LPS N-acetylglucosamine transferase